MRIEDDPGKLMLEQKQRLLDAKTIDEFRSALNDIFKSNKVTVADIGTEVVRHMSFLNGDYDQTVMRGFRKMPTRGD